MPTGLLEMPTSTGLLELPTALLEMPTVLLELPTALLEYLDLFLQVYSNKSGGPWPPISTTYVTVIENTKQWMNVCY